MYEAPKAVNQQRRRFAPAAQMVRLYVVRAEDGTKISAKVWLRTMTEQGGRERSERGPMECYHHLIRMSILKQE